MVRCRGVGGLSGLARCFCPWTRFFVHRPVHGADDSWIGQRSNTEPHTQRSGLPNMSGLVEACLGGNADLVRKILKGGADINERDSSGNTGLVVAAYTGATEVAWTLLDVKGVKVDARGAGMTTALVTAARQGNAEIVQLLLSNGADKSLKDEQGATALSAARLCGHDEIVDILDPAGASARRPLMEEEEDDEDEDDGKSEAKMRPLVVGKVVILDHVVKLSCPLPEFGWDKYAATIARLAGGMVTTEDVLVTPEPGNGVIEARTTVLLRLKGVVGTRNGIDEVMNVVRALNRQEQLEKASQGHKLRGLPQCEVVGEVEAEGAILVEAIKALWMVRSSYSERVVQFEESRATKGESAPREMALAASQAILLLRPGREAIKELAAQSAKARERRNRRGGR